MKAITDRRSIRKYKDIPLEEEKINDILRAALLAPSAKNRQPWKFIVYQGEAKKRLVAAMEKGIKREQSGITDLPGFAYGLPDAAHTLEIMKAVPVLVAVLNTNGGTFYEEIGAERRLFALDRRSRGKYAFAGDGAWCRLSVDRQHLLCI